MSTEISRLIDELNALKMDLKRRNAETRNMNTRKKEIENEIATFLKEKDQPGVKYKGQAIIAKTVRTRSKKKKEVKMEDGKEVLLSYGIEDPERVLNELLLAMRGDAIEVTRVEIAKVSDKK